MKQKVALVLSGGGARGIAHIGVIEELEIQGFEISSIAGTSMGAVVGGVYALGKLEAFKKWMITLDKLKVFNLVDFTFSSQGLVKGDKVFKKMKEFIKDGNIEDLKIPFAAVAVDLLNKKEVVFTSGSIYDAIRASVSIPSVLTPVKMDGALLVDGGVLNNIPVSQVKRTTDDILVAVDVNANIPVLKPASSKREQKEKQTVYQEKMQHFQAHLKNILAGEKEVSLGYFDLVNQTIGLMAYAIARNAIEKNPPDVLINISKRSAGTYDFYKAEELVEMGRYSARECLKNLHLNQ
jgi:NTE family protein